METRWRFDPSRPIAQVHEPNLHHQVTRNNHRYATISEYAQGSGLDTARVAAAFLPLVDAGVVTLEVAGAEVFVLTSPHGRPGMRHLPEIAPNLWEMLRRHSTLEQSYLLWKVVRELERAGWEVEADPGQIASGLALVPGMSAPRLGVYVGQRCVPVVAYPSLTDLASPDGVCEAFTRAGSPALAVLVPSGGLDDAVTAVRRWALTRPSPSRLVVLACEAPSFDPVALTAADPAVRPVAVDRLSADAWLGDQ